MGLDDGPVSAKSGIEIREIGMIGCDEGDTIVVSFAFVFQSIVTF